MDMSEYKQAFQEEASEHLQQLNDSLLKLEQDQGNIDEINVMFRAAHTLKGMASTMGFSSIAEVTHDMENLMDCIRNSQIRLNEKIIELLFECLDTIESLVEIDSENDIEISDLKKRLNDVIKNGGTEQDNNDVDNNSAFINDEMSEGIYSDSVNITNSFDFTDDEWYNVKDAYQNGHKVVVANVSLDDSCILKSARSSLVLKKIREYGSVIKTEPSMDELDNEKFDTGFSVVFMMDMNEASVTDAIKNVAEVNDVLISELFFENDDSDHEGGVSQLHEQQHDEDQKSEIDNTTDNNAPNTSSGTGSSNSEMKNIQSVRIDINRLDNLMNLVGELIINKIRINQLASDYNIKEVDDTLADLDRLTNDIQTEVMEARMVPMDYIFSRFPRMVRDLSKSQGKKVNLKIEGKDIELDRTILDEIGDPLVHLLRNSVDHGIEEPEERKEIGKRETGQIRLSAIRERNSVLVEVEDDGKGMSPDKLREVAVKKGLMFQSEVDKLSDEEALNLIFTPGFSGAETVTDVSGRGVGMDAVKAKIEDLGGSVKTESSEGKGTKIQLQLPLTIAIIQSIMVKVSEETYVIPLTNVVRNVNINRSDIKTIKGESAVMLRGEVLPIVWLHDVLNTDRLENVNDERLTVVVVERMGKKVGLVVDSLVGQQEVMIKTLDNKLLKNTKGFAGATILGDGNVALILDISTLI